MASWNNANNTPKKERNGNQDKNVLKYPKEFFCSLSGAVMTTPVKLTATGQSYDLAVLTKALRQNPLQDPLTGRAIESNAMEIDFNLQARIEEFDAAGDNEGEEKDEEDKDKKNNDDDGVKGTCIVEERTGDVNANVPIAPPKSFALDFINEFSDSDEESCDNDISPTNDRGDSVREESCDNFFPSTNDRGDSVGNESCDNVFSSTNDQGDIIVIEDESCDNISSPTNGRSDSVGKKNLPTDTLDPSLSQADDSISVKYEDPQIEESTTSNNHTKDLQSSHAQTVKPIEFAYPVRNPREHGFSNLKEHIDTVDFSGSPMYWKHPMRNVEIIRSLINRSKKEYSENILLNGVSSRSKVSNSRTPYMWGYGTKPRRLKHSFVGYPKGQYETDDPDILEPPSAMMPPGCAAGPGGRQQNNPRRNGGNTALHVASQNGYLNVVSCLKDAGAALDIKNGNDCTPLVLACQQGHYDIVEYFLECGASFRMIRKSDICSHGKMDDVQTKKKISSILNVYRKKAGLSYLR